MENNNKLSFAGAIGVCFKKFVNFRGVATRREYWYFVLFIVLVSIVIGQLDQIIFPELTQQATVSAEALLSYLETAPATVDWSMFTKAISDSINASPISNFVSFATTLPLLTVTVRRMRDAGFGGWWLLLIWVQLFVFVITLLPTKAKSL
jgi:uncharacterized membrane protein YhaH (DUF805 family)